MAAVSLDRINEELLRIYHETPENICGIGFGYKIVAGKTQPVPSIIFHVEQKKPLSEISESERIPEKITIDGQEFVTDVIETPPGSTRFLDTCYHPLDQSDPEIARLQGFPTPLLPMRGGQEIVMFPAEYNRYGGFVVGTLGFFAIDGEDGKVVGVTNTHVVVEPLTYCGDASRAGNNRTKDIIEPKNTIEPRYWGRDGKKYPTGALIRSGADYGRLAPIDTQIYQAALHVKRYMPHYTSQQTAADPTLVNRVDAALLIMNDGVFPPTGQHYVDLSSRGIWRPTDYEALFPAIQSYPFATTAEIDAFAQTLQTNPNAKIYVYSTGRTTGPKGYCAQRRIIISEFVIINQSIGPGVPPESQRPDLYSKFVDLIRIAPDSTALPETQVTLGGDSGSALLADISSGGQTTRKIIGIIFAGNGSTGLACRIDRVKDALNILPWTEAYSFDRATSLAVPQPRVITRDTATYGLDLSTTVNEAGNNYTYWQAGFTLQKYPPVFDAALFNLTLSDSDIYENNIVSAVVGYFAVKVLDTKNIVIDTYTYTFIPEPTVGATNDNNKFAIVANQLRAAEVFDREVKSSYAIRVRATNSSGQYVDKQFTITVKDIADRPITDILFTQVDTDIGQAGRFIGTLSATSLNAADVFTYFLVNGDGATDNNSFAISGASVFSTEAITVAGLKNIRVMARNNYNLTREETFTLTFS